MWLHQFDFQSALAAGCKNEDHAEWQPKDPTAADEPPPPDPEEEEEGEQQGGSVAEATASRIFAQPQRRA